MREIDNDLKTVEERLQILEEDSWQTVQALQKALKELKMRNEWLESQTPEARAARQLQQDLKRRKEILKKKDNLLNLLDLTHIVNQEMEQVPQIDPGMFKKSVSRQLPLRWDPLTKRWMGPDQIVVETAFSMPLDTAQTD